MSALVAATIAETRLGTSAALVRFYLAADQLREVLKFNPNWSSQPRVPAGNPDGGQWTDGGGRVIAVQARPPGPRGGAPRRIGGNWRDITPEQATRLEISHAQMQAAVRQVQRLEPRWKPRPSLYETVEGEIAANTAARREAENRYNELQRMGVAPGPFAVESQPARGPSRKWTIEEIFENNRLGRLYGCHTCGTKEPGTPRGNFIPDHQVPTALNGNGRLQRLFPQCLTCSSKQGGHVTSLKRGNSRE